MVHRLRETRHRTPLSGLVAVKITDHPVPMTVVVGPMGEGIEYMLPRLPVVLLPRAPLMPMELPIPIHHQSLTQKIPLCSLCEDDAESWKMHGLW